MLHRRLNWCFESRGGFQTRPLFRAEPGRQGFPRGAWEPERDEGAASGAPTFRPTWECRRAGRLPHHFFVVPGPSLGTHAGRHLLLAALEGRATGGRPGRMPFAPTGDRRGETNHQVIAYEAEPGNRRQPDFSSVGQASETVSKPAISSRDL